MSRLPFLVGALLALALAGTGLVSLARSEPAATIPRASFDADGSVQLPVGYRRWVHVGSRVKPIGINIFDGKTTKTPEALETYVEPSAFDIFEKTGKWPDGAQIVKEFSSIRVGKDCDAKSMVCNTPFGVGIFETGYIGLGLMVKDAARFADGKGNWGYFDFGHKPQPYDSRSARMGADKCQYCHEALASETDYVVSRSHIGLASRP